MNLALGALAASLVLMVALALRTALVGGRAALVAGRLHDRTTATSRSAALLAAWPEPPAPVARSLAGAGLTIDARQAWNGWLASIAVMAGAAVLASGPALALVVTVVLVAGPAATLQIASGRADRLLENGLPDALESMARALRSGASLRQAVDEAGMATPGRLGADLVGVAHEVRHGRALVDALDEWAERRPLPGVRLATSALGLGAETGGAQARALDGVAATLRSRQAVGREVRALSSQARMSGVVITLAPLGFSALAVATDERTASFLLATPLGLVCLTAGLALDGAAALWMHRLARVEA